MTRIWHVIADNVGFDVNDVTAGNIPFSDASSRTLKQDIRPLVPTAAAGTLAALAPVTFAYRDAPGDPRVGFVAEDVPELVATPGRQTLLQAQQKAIAELTARLTALEARP